MFNNNGYSLADIAAATGNGNGGGFGGFNGDGAWIILLFIIVLMGGWGNNGWNGNGNGGGGNGATYITSDVQRGFDQAALTSGITNISTNLCNGFAGVQQSLCNGFADVNGAVTNGFAQAEIANNARQMADMQQNFSIQSALQQCCCDNRAAVADLKYTVATEACADRNAVSDALRDVIASNTANTQAILDKLCQQEINALKTENANLQTQLNMATLRESQSAQNAFIQAGLTNEVDALYNRLSNCPVPSIPVYGRQPVFTCGQNSGCRCNGNGFYN